MSMWEIEKIVSKGEYNYAVVPDHPDASDKGYVLEHRIVAENNLGRRLKEGEIVHHINEDKKDNSWENLEVKNGSEHVSEHQKKKGVLFVLLQCPWCGENFVRERRRTFLVKGGDKTACSRKCNGKLFHLEQRYDKNVLGCFRARREYLENLNRL